MLHVLCVVQTVSLHKLASAMEHDSNLRRMQSFIARYALSLDHVAKMIFSMLSVKGGACAEYGPYQSIIKIRNILSHSYN